MMSGLYGSSDHNGSSSLMTSLFGRLAIASFQGSAHAALERWRLPDDPVGCTAGNRAQLFPRERSGPWLSLFPGPLSLLPFRLM